jgi:GGDEF domain-containing protein
MGAWVAPGTTMVTMGDASGKSVPAVEPLRGAGAGALLVVPLAAGNAALGFVALADRSSLAPDTERTELVEALALQAAAQLRGLAAVAELRDRTTRDPLTGLGHQATFDARLPRRRRAAARAGRRVALVLAGVDHPTSDDVLRRTAALLEDVAPAGAAAYRLDGDRFALLLESEDRSAAQEVAWRLQTGARERLGATLSVAVTLAEGAESDADLLERAGQALRLERRAG